MGELNILYGCDETYAPYTGVSMTSLFENNRDVEEITVYLAAMGFSQESLGRFALLAEEYGFRPDVIAEIKDQWGHGMQDRDSAMRLIESMVAKEYRDHP